MWYIFRHGETLYNKNRITQGYVNDSFLTLNGVIQAHMNGVKLKQLEKNTDFHNYKFVCTPLERTYHTCQLIMESLGIIDMLPTQEELIISRGKGTAEKKESKEHKVIKYENVWNYEENNGETYKESYTRLAKFIEKYKNERNLIIVAHKGVNRNLMYLLKKSKEIDNLSTWISNLTDEEGNNLIYDLKCEVPTFNQNYFYSWDGNNFTQY